MALFSKESLETLRSRVDLVDVVSGYVEIKRAGAVYKGCCPFHDEKTPSFTIRKGDTHYHCFGCGAHGDAIEFLMQNQTMAFTEAVEHLAQKFGVPLQKDESQEKGPDKRRLKSAMAEAAELYHFLLLQTPSGHEALAYLKARGIGLDFIQRFKLGYAPSGAEMIRPLMEKKGFTAQELQEVGVLNARGRPFFSDRILFPIYEPSGAVVGFSGRKFKEGTFGGKYINTSETPLFYKSRILFGLNESRRRITKEKRAILVEGQIDCLRLVLAGLDLAVAPLGTAFGEGHIKLLTNLGVQSVLIAFDSDKAGRAASLKAGHQLQKAGISVKVATLSPGSDPDTIVVEQGLQGFVSAIKSSEDYLAYLVGQLGQEHDMGDPASKAHLVKEAKRQIDEWDDPVMVRESLRRLSHLAQVPESMVGVGEISPSQMYVQSSGYTGEVQVDPNRVIETDLLRWLLLMGDEVVPVIESNLKAGSLRDPICAKIFGAYLNAFHEDRPRDLLSLAIDVDDEEGQEVLTDILKRRVNRERAGELMPEAIQKLLERDWMQQCNAVQQSIEHASEDEQLKLAKEYAELRSARPEVQWPT